LISKLHTVSLWKKRWSCNTFCHSNKR